MVSNLAMDGNDAMPKKKKKKKMRERERERERERDIYTYRHMISIIKRCRLNEVYCGK